MQQKPKYTILVVDDEEQLRRLILKAFELQGYVCHEASDGEKALEVLSKENVDVVITDVAMPNMDGIELTASIKALNGPDVIMMTGYAKDLSYGDAVAKGASDFIQKPFELKEMLIRLKRVLRERAMRAELKDRVGQLMTALEGVVQALSMSIEARDPYTAGHQRRVAELAVEIAGKMELSEDLVAGIRMAGVIHDLGKIALPAEILSKPSRLSDLEFSMIKTHPEVGYNILKEISFPWPVAETVYQHHERINGSGYPRGLTGDEIILEARIMAVADVVEAIASHRPYRPALGIGTAVKEISQNAGIFYDPDVVEVCLDIIGKREFQFSS
jgi:putative two-component system response regulator